MDDEVSKATEILFLGIVEESRTLQLIVQYFLDFGSIHLTRPCRLPSLFAGTSEPSATGQTGQRNARMRIAPIMTPASGYIFVLASASGLKKIRLFYSKIHATSDVPYVLPTRRLRANLRLAFKILQHKLAGLVKPRLLW
jgi:hypothetical protein